MDIGEATGNLLGAAVAVTALGIVARGVDRAVRRTNPVRRRRHRKGVWK